MKQHIEFDLDFKRNTYGGLYIVLEGINASGKSTQLELLKIYFEDQGKTVVVTNEPNEELAIGKMIREIITKTRDVPPAALQYLYTADRIVNHERIVAPALKKGHIVLSSRSFWSAIVWLRRVGEDDAIVVLSVCQYSWGGGLGLSVYSTLSTQLSLHTGREIWMFSLGFMRCEK